MKGIYADILLPLALKDCLRTGSRKNLPERQRGDNR